ncbi:hypothetical protein [Yersinia enterocolitica]|uniref:hypothetical protein n=1 Tax=Yersinia enterocolitica TaxID=630 RepID=UPI0029B4D7CD|nr:hypothetical protein [Yersinia enterocolitica]
MEWFNNNASAVIAASAALLAAIVAGGFALLGAIVNNKANKQQREELFQAERWKSNRQLFIEKGEEAIGLISSLSNEFIAVVNATTIDTVGGQDGAISDKVKERLINTNSGAILDRLDTLITAYFPELLPLKEDILKIYQLGIRKYFEYVMGKVSKQDAAIDLLKCNESLVKKAQDFKLELSRKISQTL